MRLIDANRRIEVLERDKDIENAVNQYVSVQPTAYDVDKVVEELKELEGVQFDGENESYQLNWCIETNRAIEIVKQGGIRNNRKDCEYRHDNGNCLKVGGFCTAVDNKHCEKLKQSGVADDVCEWESVSDGEFIQNPHTKRLYSNEPSMKNVYCNTCGKKIRIVGD